MVEASPAASAGIASGEIHVKAGMVQHAVNHHGDQIYKNVLSMIMDVLSNYNEIREGSDNSILLVLRPQWDKSRQGRKPSAIVAIGLSKTGNGVYEARTALLMKDSDVIKKRLLSKRSKPISTGPDSSVTSQSAHPTSQGDSRASIARQESNL